MNYLELLDQPSTPTTETIDTTKGRDPHLPYSRGELEAYRRECLEPPEGEVYVRAGTLRQCQRCHDLEARGVVVLHCSECDVLTDCHACKRLGVVCGMHFFPEGEDPPGPVIGTEELNERGHLRYRRHGRQKR